MYGLLGTGAVDGVFATYCTGFGECLNFGHDYFNFSTSGLLPTNQEVVCGYYAVQDGKFFLLEGLPRRRQYSKR